MRILYLSSAPYPATRQAGGWETHIREAVRALSERAAAVRLVTGEGGVADALTTPSAPRLRRVVPRVVRNLRRELLELRHDRALLPRARAAADEFRPDVIYERAAVLHLTGVRLARACGVPLVLEQNAPQVDERAALGGMALGMLARRMERLAYGAAAGVVTVSAALREYVIGMGAPRELTHVVPNGARAELFDPAVADAAAVRRRFQLPAGAVVAGFVGAFADWHGLDALVRAFARARRDAPADLYLMLVGDGPQRPSLEAMARELAIQPHVRFAGAVPFETVPDYLAAMEIAVMPGSNWYGSPIKIFEYGAMGRAIIAPDTAPVREVMEDEAEGLIVSPGSVEALHAALCRLAGDPLRRAQMGSRFRARVLRQYTWSQVADRLIAICGEAVARRQSGFNGAAAESDPVQTGMPG